LDPAYANDGESFRPIQQIFEGLVTTKQGGTDVVPVLAETWQPSSDGITWTFNLRKNVKFQDGTLFSAAAVCFSFDRWYNVKGIQQSSSISYCWSTVFGGFAHNDDPKLGVSLYKSCQAKDDNTAVFTLTSASSTLLSGLTLPAFSIASPDAGRHRPGHRAVPGPDHRRRAGVRPRRVNPGPGGQPAGGAAAAAEPDLFGDRPRSGRGAPHQRDDRRHVPRRDR
jgi:hypothetical protein